MTIELRVPTGAFVGWKSVSVQASIESVFRSFAFEAIDVNLPTKRPPQSPVLIRPTGPCEVWTDDAKVVSGYIDKLHVRSTSTSTGISVNGRSKTEDIADCTVIDRQRWRSKRVERIVSDICEPFGIDVVVDEGVDTGEPLSFRVKRAERAFQAISRLAERRGLLVTDDEQGHLVLSRAGATMATTALESPGNVLESDGTFDASQLYSQYSIRNQVAVPTDNPAQLTSLARTFVQDDTMDRFRPLEILPSGRTSPSRAKDLVTNEAAVRAGRAVELNVLVSGWTQGDGSLWRPNQIIQYTDIVQGVVADLLCVSVDYQLDIDQGETARIFLSPPSGYELLTEPERRKRTSKRRPKPAATEGVGVWRELDQVLVSSTSGIPAVRPDSRGWWDKGKATVRRK